MTRAPSIQCDPSMPGGRGRCELMRGYLDFEVLGDRLAALSAVVGDAAEDVQLRHVPRRAAARDLIADGAVAVDEPLAAVLAEASDICLWTYAASTVPVSRLERSVLTRDGTLVIASASGSQLSTPWTRSSTALPWRSRSNAARSSPGWTAYPAQVAATGRHRALATDPVLRSLTWRITRLR